MFTGFEVGTVLEDKYVIERKLGEGAMGVVFSGTDTMLDRKVAIKVLQGGDPINLKLEARAMARIRSDHVVQVYSYGTHASRPYIVMELVEGTNLEDVIEQQAPLDAAAVVTLTNKIAAGLGAAHEHDLVHYDVKPANILVGPRYRVAVADFGLAQIKKSRGTAFGSPAYMAPEIARGRELERGKRHLTDQYSLAVTVFEMLTRRLPFEENQVPLLLAAKVHNPAPTLRSRDAGAPAALEAAVARGLAIDANDRFSDCITFARALEEAWKSTRQLTRKRVLVVDDDPFIRELFTAVLEEHFLGIEVFCAADGFVGLEMAAAVKPHLAIIDIDMPRLNGVELAHGIRNDANLAYLPVVVVSSLVGGARPIKGGVHITKILSAFGAKEQLAKPITPDALVDAVRHYLV